MLTSVDLQLLESKKITEKQVKEQLSRFEKGFPFLQIKGAATVQRGVRKVDTEEANRHIKRWKDYLPQNKRILKFIPSSGAASRMFKDLYGYLSADYDMPTTAFEQLFFAEITHFAFYDTLNRLCLEKEGADIPTLIERGAFKIIVANLLTKEGLNYGSLPKGLLLFHAYPDEVRTALEEHLIEGASYAKNQADQVNIHLTVSPEHQPLFEQLVETIVPKYEHRYGVKYAISFSTQQPSSDTIAVDMQNRPFRNNDGSLLFRPGGHGALIENLNKIDAEIIFIKNIDNVVSEHLKEETVAYKQMLAGILVDLQSKIFNYIKLIESGDYTEEQVKEMTRFLEDELCIVNPEIHLLEDVERILYIRSKLKRPLRVCGMVRNTGEPGGGPFFTVNDDGTIALQILEQSQIDLTNAEAKSAFDHSSHFNPVDLVCAVKDYKGEKYDLQAFVDHNTGFISEKSKDGRELKALELPGLWNGAMSDWNTVFVEVPITTFNPVKTVNDLLRSAHQPAETKA